MSEAAQIIAAHQWHSKLWFCTCGWGVRYDDVKASVLEAHAAHVLAVLSETHVVVERDGLYERIADIPDLTSHGFDVFDPTDGTYDGRAVAIHGPHEVARRVVDALFAEATR